MAAALPHWPRVQRAKVAAAYAGYSSERAFLGAVAQGDMPHPFPIGGADAWDITDLDAAVDAIKSGGSAIGNWRKGAEDYASTRRVARRRG
jgi:hypothetical protein